MNTFESKLRNTTSCRVSRIAALLFVAALLSAPPAHAAAAAGESCASKCASEFLPKIAIAQDNLVDAWNSADLNCCSQVGGTVIPYPGHDGLPGQLGCAAEPNCMGEYVDCMSSSPMVILAQGLLAVLEAQYQQCLDGCNKKKSKSLSARTVSEKL